MKKTSLGIVLAVTIIAGFILFVDYSVTLSNRQSCVAEAESLNWNYRWDASYGCRVQINGHWWTLEGISTAPAP